MLATPHAWVLNCTTALHPYACCLCELEADSTTEMWEISENTPCKLPKLPHYEGGTKKQEVVNGKQCRVSREGSKVRSK